MNRKIIAGITIGLLFLAFGLVSLLVILSKRHPYFVAKKLRLGALILSISGASVGCFTTTCYVPAPTNIFHIDQAIASSDSIVIRKSISDTITGTISEREGNTFSYALFDSSDSIILKNNIQPIDVNFDEGIEEFKISLGPSILPGKYDLKFYHVPLDTIQNFDWCARSFSLTITD
ncbi:MAG TPA: hypothetical protein VHO70_19190 [Chitinispirillaceae bacterium]|nr:hypothetical protein [Chitinispirillaceae bacterium]